jgi:hypothetical protein
MSATELLNARFQERHANVIVAVGSALGLVGLASHHPGAVVISAALTAIWLLRSYAHVGLGLVLVVPEPSTGRSQVGMMPVWNRFGDAIYARTVLSVPILTFAFLALLVVGFCVPTGRRFVVVLTRDTVVLLASACALAALCVSLVEQPEAGLRAVSRGLAAASPWILFVCAYSLTRFASQRQAAQRQLLGALAFGLSVRAVSGALVLVLTGGVQLDDQAHVALLDIAAPLVGAAVCLGVLVAGLNNRLASLPLLLLGAVAVMIAFRRSIFVEILAGAILAPYWLRRRDVSRRVIVLGTAVTAAILLLPASVNGGAAARFVDIGSSLVNPRPETSATLHVNDIKIGLDLALSHPWSGLGINSGQPREFVNFGANFLYVHNDFLQTWLRLGLVVVFFHLLLLLLLAARGLATLRSTSNWVNAGAAMTVVLCFIPLMTAPFFVTTQAFPLLLGVAAALGAAVPADPTRVTTTSGSGSGAQLE